MPVHETFFGVTLKLRTHLRLGQQCLLQITPGAVLHDHGPLARVSASMQAQLRKQKFVRGPQTQIMSMCSRFHAKAAVSQVRLGCVLKSMDQANHEGMLLKQTSGFQLLQCFARLVAAQSVMLGRLCQIQRGNLPQRLAATSSRPSRSKRIQTN